MSGLKRWLVAIAILLLAAGWLQFGEMFTSGVYGQCLDGYAIGSPEVPVLALLERNGLTPANAKQGFYVIIDGKLKVYVELTDGQFLASGVCMTGEPSNPTPVLLEK